MRFAEMRQDCLPPAGGRLADRQQRIQLAAFDAFDLVGRATLVDHPPALDHIGHAIGHPHLGRQAVTPGAPVS